MILRSDGTYGTLQHYTRMRFQTLPAQNKIEMCIRDSNDALLYRLGMIEEAEKSIILSTFDFNDDEAGQDILSALLNAADRGVDIRVIVDGISGFMDVQHNPWFLALDAHKNAQVRIYNPVNFLKPWDMQARLHDKYLIIDDQMYTLGGRNTTNRFLGDYSKGKNIDKELFVYETDPGKNMQNTSMSVSYTHLPSGLGIRKDISGTGYHLLR